MMVVKRTGEIVDFDSSRIKNAIMKAFNASKEKLNPAIVDDIMTDIVLEIQDRFKDFYPNVENIQDIVEKHIVKKELYEVAKSYILYRSERQKIREQEKEKDIEKILLGKLKIRKRDGRTVLFDINRLKDTIRRAAEGFKEVSVDTIAKESIKSMYDGIKTEEVERALILASVSYIEKDPNYNYVSARLFMQKLYKEVIGRSLSPEIKEILYKESFIHSIKKGVENGLFAKELLDFDLVKMSRSLMLERDELFQYMGIQTLYERYFTKLGNKRLELPQSFWMRVAMGLAINEKDKEAKAMEFYDLLSSLRFVSSTPTLFHSGTSHPQLSSCYLTTITDDLKHIFKCLGDNAHLSKWSGGLGNDWTNIRGTGSWIKSTNVESQGVIPFLKIANDVTMAINRSGKRRGATCAYLETWHLDIEDFLDLRKNTGDERRRTHDMNTSNWIPDLFMKRVIENKEWTLFSPDEVPELHHIYGKEFEAKYEEYEQKTKEGKIRKFKTMSASKLWRKMLSMLFETGHPWITFKDPCNIRSPQDHVGVVHSSNLCTEITLNTSKDETAVCNLGSINLSRHVIDGKLDMDLLEKSAKTAIRMLDNVIEINFYPTDEAKNSNMQHRPIGLGVMGLQDALYKVGFPFDSEQALKFMDKTMEAISYYVILSSSEIAKEKGAYESYKGSKWDRGIFPIDSLKLLEQERGMSIDVPKEETLDWSKVREHVKKYGMRNSNTMAIAPTATISNIAGCFPCIEPIYKNIYVKSNISGEFTVVNSYLVDDLKKEGLWNEEMLEQLKYYDGSVQMVPSIPENLKSKYKEAFEVDAENVIKHAALRNKWIDQSQSINVFMKGTSGKKLNDTYVYAWKMGLKTTYYLRSMAASQIEKSTLDASKYGFTQKRQYDSAKTEEVQTPEISKPVIVGRGAVCNTPDDEECEACQ
ncbi:ribonucleoside-diphosphate reductase subunit alpha [Candidatus Woesearchaeota archaeon]|nr:ribonucleoside-diphosphate reductase subunit alpha [Candidatus Woesearchaeota archaeon]